MALEITKPTSRGIDATVWVIGSQSYSRESGELCFEMWGYSTQELADKGMAPLETRIETRPASKETVAQLYAELQTSDEWSDAVMKADAADAQAVKK